MKMYDTLTRKFFYRCDEGLHRFEPRYDKSEPKIPWELIESISTSPLALERLREVRYVCDICVLCGEVIHREQENDDTPEWETVGCLGGR